MNKDQLSAYWNNRVNDFIGQFGTPESYVRTFLELADIEPGSNVFDMGCGPGTLAIPLAQAGCTVEACDISPRMLEVLKGQAEKLGLSIRTHLLAWEDDWNEKGVEPGCCDFAIASRSISTENLESCLGKLDSVAARRAMVTIPSGPICDVDPHLMNALGRPIPDVDPRDDAVDFLRSRGRDPEVMFIAVERWRYFEDFEYAVSELAKMVGPDPLTDEELAVLRDYSKQHFRQEETPDGLRWRMDYTLTVLWALIAWDV